MSAYSAAVQKSWGRDATAGNMTRCKAVAEAIAKFVKPRRQNNIIFVRAGEQLVTAQTSSGMLNSASDWDLCVNLGRQLKLPNYIMVNMLRPDMALSSPSSKLGLLIELTVPCEDRMEEANENNIYKISRAGGAVSVERLEGMLRAH